MTPPAETTNRPLIALSSMWAVQERFERDLPAFVARAAELGFEGIEANASMDADQVRAIVAGALPLTSVHAPAPLERLASGAWNRDLNLAATDEAERASAVRFTRRSIEVAADAGARFVIVHLGEAGDEPLDGERRLRTLHGRGETAGEAWDAARDDAVRERARIVPPYLEQGRRSLEELTGAAAAAGVTIGLESRLRYHEIPLPEEAVELLAGYPSEVVGYWHDVGHCEVQHRLGLIALGSWLELLGDRAVGTHLHDVRGILDHRAPGNGDVDFARLAARLPAAAARTFEIDQHEPDADVARALELLRGARVVGG